MIQWNINKKIKTGFNGEELWASSFFLKIENDTIYLILFIGYLILFILMPKGHPCLFFIFFYFMIACNNDDFCQIN
jgi:hypothetical protein